MIKVRTVHQIEITSRCNLRCRYCPSPNLPRPKQDISDEHFRAGVDLARFYMRRGTQHRELNLAGIGESTMHPQFVPFIEYARTKLGPSIDLLFATNGILFTDELAKAIAPFKPSVWVSLHRPEKAGPAVEIAKKYGLLKGVSNDPSLAAVDWAGQVDWHVSAPRRMQCDWVRGGWVMVMADGRLTTCCFDASGAGVIGMIGDDPETLFVRPYGLCKTCHLDVGVAA